MKILYGVPGEGMGHATRSKVIIAHLLKKHDVKIVSSRRAFDFLNKNFPGRVIKIEGFHIAYKDGEVSKFNTFAETLKSGPKNLKENFSRYFALAKSFMPDLVITDFESFTYYFAKHHGIPVLNIDNMQVIDRAKPEIEIPKTEKTNYQIAKNIIKLKVPNCNQYLITSFFYPPLVKKNTAYIPPILRDEIIQASKSIKNHILVYQTSSSQGNLVKILQELPNETFFVYGFNQDKVLGNVVLKSFSESGFINDLSSAKAVISNGGFSLISEAVYLNKPICSCPIAGQFEQYLNAAYIEFLGYGKHIYKFNPDLIKAFLYDLEKYSNNIGRYKQIGNEDCIKAVDRVINELNININ